MHNSPYRLHRDLLRLEGPDTVTLLNGLLTTNIEKLDIGAIQHTALLTPQGKIIDTMFLIRTGEDIFYLDALAGRGPVLHKKLMLYRLRAKVDITDVTAEMAVGIGLAPEAALFSGPDPRLTALPPRWITPVVTSDTLPHQDELYIAEEVRLGVPAYGTAYQETDAFPLGVNLDLLGGIDHHKGCFVGQEVASRMFRKGNIRKRTWHAYGPGLSPCLDVKADGRTVAMISAATGETGLALMHLDRIGEVTELSATTPDGQTIRLVKPDYVP